MGQEKFQHLAGVDDILNELKSNTDELVSNDNISEVISRTSRRSGATKNINITNRRRPARSINLNLGN